MLGGSDPLATFQLPKFEWVQPALEFLSPTFAEFLLFFATLVLFIASWKDLRRAMIMTFGLVVAIVALSVLQAIYGVNAGVYR